VLKIKTSDVLKYGWITYTAFRKKYNITNVTNVRKKFLKIVKKVNIGGNFWVVNENEASKCFGFSYVTNFISFEDAVRYMSDTNLVATYKGKPYAMIDNMLIDKETMNVAVFKKELLLPFWLKKSDKKPIKVNDRNHP